MNDGTAIDPYVRHLAEEIAAQLSAAGHQVKLTPLYHNMAVHLLRDDQENYGLWISTIGYSVQKKACVGGLWPYYGTKQEHPLESPTVHVAYGREVHAAARDAIRRLMPRYQETWDKLYTSVINYRDRDRRRDSFLETLKAIPGVNLHTWGDERAFDLEFPEAGEHLLRRHLRGKMWSDGEVHIDGGTLTEEQFTRVCQLLAGGQVSEPAAVYRRQRRQYKEVLLFVRDHDSYVTWYRDAEQVAALLQKTYDGVSPFRIALPLFDDIALRMVRAGKPLAVLFDPEALDAHAARQVDLYDLLQNEQLENDERHGPASDHREVPVKVRGNGKGTEGGRHRRVLPKGKEALPPRERTGRRFQAVEKRPRHGSQLLTSDPTMPNNLVEAPTPRESSTGYSFMCRRLFSHFKERKDLKFVIVRCDGSREHCLRALRELPTVNGWNVFTLHVKESKILECELMLGSYPSGHSRGGGRMLQTHHEQDVEILRKKCIATMRAWVVRNIPK